MKFIFIRHTTTDWNVRKRIQGQTDIELNEAGRAEARQLAQSLVGTKPGLIISSDLKRASETAEIINSVFRVPLRLDERLRECSFGKMEGLTLKEIGEKFGEKILLHWYDDHKDYDFRSFGGESCKDIIARQMEVISSILKERPVNTVIIVGHGRALNTLLPKLGSQPELKQGEYRVVEI